MSVKVVRNPHSVGAKTVHYRVQFDVLNYMYTSARGSKLEGRAVIESLIVYAFTEATRMMQNIADIKPINDTLERDAPWLLKLLKYESLHRELYQAEYYCGGKVVSSPRLFRVTEERLEAPVL